ncbi:hypothetical protein PCASD_03166 [Puccinia coronata f. sp. avenae]|uniref:RxLR effector protein n=1 Tax=Puccinia coronata f. sp. avenae TaxID=200324 RepID=A0A2N5RXZ4_9BASI|nr:hypothetical protein PCASD_26802 [Puccinia coronata f. sp. avenae]PLW48718.1 hypothetical protein PCASD_03166 [Puccinia coronata f. sp. avenae]
MKNITSSNKPSLSFFICLVIICITHSSHSLSISHNLHKRSEVVTQGFSVINDVTRGARSAMGDSDSLEGVAKIEENKGVKLGLQPVKENEPHIKLETARPTGKLKTLDELSSKLNPIPWASDKNEENYSKRMMTEKSHGAKLFHEENPSLATRIEQGSNE